MLNAAHHILARANEPAIRSRTAIHYAKAGRITQVSYAEFTSLVNRAANALKQLGAQRGERIPVLMNDAPLAAATMLAAMLIGAVPIPTNTKLRADEYAYIASDAGAKLFIADDEFLPLLSDVAGTRIIFIDTPNGFDDAFKSLVGRASSASFPAHTEADDAAFWLYSSGTTGKPKAIIHTHRSAAQTSKLLTEVMGITPESVVYCTSKLFFTFAFDNAFLGPLKAGAATVCTHEWADPDTVLRQIEAIRPTAFLSVPTFFRRVLALPDDNKIDLHIETDDEAYLTVDGQLHVQVRHGDTVSLTAAPDPCLFARVQERAYFTSTLMNRLRRSE